MGRFDCMYYIRCLKINFCNFQSKIQPTYTTYVKPTIHIDDETIARDIKDLNDVLKDQGVGEDEAKKYHGKWLVLYFADMNNKICLMYIDNISAVS